VTFSSPPGEPGSNAPHYEPPQYGAPQYAPPVYGPPEPQYVPQYGPPAPQYVPPYGPPPAYPLMPPAPPARRRGRLISVLTAVAVLGGGGVATYVALSDTNSDQGAASPREAVESVVTDINNSDLIGMLGALAPAERISIAEPLIKDLDELKRTHVLSSDADLSHVAGASAAIKGLTFGPTVTINDHVQVVQLTGGTVRIDADASKLPFSKEFVRQVFPHGGLTGSETQTVDLARVIRANDGHLIRIATEKVGGRWYPSLLYTIADNATAAAELPNPTATDRIPAVGAGSPEDAVKKLVTTLLDGDIAGAIKVLSPDELAALHDYGGVILAQVGSTYPPAPVKLESLSLNSRPGPDGTQLVSLDSASVLVKHVGRMSISIDGDCVRMTIAGHTQRFCTNQAVSQLDQLAKAFVGHPLTSAQRKALQDLTSGSSIGGIVTTQSGGKWFVNPVRTIFATTTGLLQSLQDDDLLQLIGLIREFAG
jgi:hypothetical protein